MKKTQVHGHRGIRKKLPENTIPAIQKAIDVGVDAVEIDVCLTKDNVPIVVHDPILSPQITREENGEWLDEILPVSQLTVNEIKRFQVGAIKPGSSYAKKFPKQIPLPHVQIPTLQEVITYIKRSGSSITLNIELKNSLENIATFDPDIFTYCVDSIISKENFQAKVFIQSFDWRLSTLIKKKDPTLKIGFITDSREPAHFYDYPVPSAWTLGQNITNQSIPLLLKKLGADVWSSYNNDLSLEKVQTAHDLNLEVYAWTVNDTDTIKKMIGYGVDALISDDPEKALNILNR